jgi:hypothetical protein
MLMAIANGNTFKTKINIIPFYFCSNVLICTLLKRRFPAGTASTARRVGMPRRK